MFCLFPRLLNELSNLAFMGKISYPKKPTFTSPMSSQIMSIKTSVSLLIVSVLVLPSGISRAGDIDVQTSNVRVTVGKNGGINIQSKSPGVIAIPHRQLSNPSLRRQHWPKLNRTSKYNTRIKQATLCNGRTSSHQSTQISGGSRGSQTQTTSTTVCR